METAAYLYSANSRRNDRDTGSRRFEEEGKGNARKSTLYFEQGTGLQQEINFAGGGSGEVYVKSSPEEERKSSGGGKEGCRRETLQRIDLTGNRPNRSGGAVISREEIEAS
jgi:hypothetical protein